MTTALCEGRRLASVLLMSITAALVSCGSGNQARSMAQGESSVQNRGSNRLETAGREDEIAILDDCDPTDPNWGPIGGCALERGDVTRAEFDALLFSQLSLATVGHQAWRNEPSYVKIERNETVTVTNKGGRGHTFTAVEAFGGGRVPGLNRGLTPAPECAAATDLPPGASMDVRGLGVGNHRFQCCIHPWMRALIKVKPED
jgi:plastocyanin